MPASLFDESYADTRDALRRVATHVVSRAQHAHSSRIGLRAAPGGFGTTEYGPDSERVRVSGGALVHESRPASGATTRAIEIDGAALDDLARFVGVDLSVDFSVGTDTPPLGDVDAPIHLHGPAVRALVGWYDTAAQALDRVVVGTPSAAQPSLIQLWPEHFDVALDLAFDLPAPGERRVNLGGAVGDEFHAPPYLYVGPWTPDRPGDPGYWNAPFGAVIGFDDVMTAADPVEAALGFFRAGLERLST